MLSNRNGVKSTDVKIELTQEMLIKISNFIVGIIFQDLILGHHEFIMFS